MDELIKTFHIDVKLLLAQAVNFVIVLIILYKFAYQPALKMLNSRTGKIEKGLKDAKEAEEKLENMMRKEKEVLVEARKKAQVIMQKAREEAGKEADGILRKTKEKNEKMMAEARKQIGYEKNKMMEEIKNDVADMIVSATGKMLEGKITREKDEKIIENVLTK